jgi:hypothetical protein
MDESSMYDVVRPVLDVASKIEPPSMQCLDSKLVVNGLLVDTVKILGTPLPHGLLKTTEFDIWKFLWEGGKL